MKKTILLFDSWSFGYKFLDYYACKFKREGFHVCFAHMNSLQIKTLHQEKAQELIDYSTFVNSQIETYDVSCANTLNKLLDKYPSPEFILHLSVSHLENRFFNLCYRYSGVKKVYVQHGNIFSASLAKKTMKSLNKITNNLNVRTYFKLKKIFSLFCNYKRFSDYKETIELILQWVASPRGFILKPKRHISIYFDYAFSFSEDERLNLIDIYSFNPESTYVVCNPEIYKLSFSLKERKEFPRKIVFIDQALVESGIIRKSEQIRDFEMLKHISNILGLEFTIRLHPRSIESNYSGYGFKFYNKELTKMVSENCIYVGYNSSLMKTLLELGFSVIKLVPEVDDFRSLSILSDNEKVKFKSRYIESKSSKLKEIISELDFKIDNDKSLFQDPSENILKILG